MSDYPAGPSADFKNIRGALSIID